MSEEYKKGPHTVYDIQYHLVWVTKYRYHVLKGDVALRAREIIRQTCEARNITILRGHVSKDHIHLHVSTPPDLSPSKSAQ
ncbi:MAG: IS200/IS605 family transposase [Deltaproteobacteria bacterium]|nr:IS200/IS605 family transposase [Deltaproteobacteria bacterium]MBW2309057.1 IS200/IS605 family transposase [Deltaproteobacteria bacterium]